MEKQKIQNSQNYIEEEQSQGLTLSDLKTHYKATESGECVLALLGSRPCKLHSPQLEPGPSSRDWVSQSQSCAFAL